MDGEFYERDGRKYDRCTRVLDYFQPPFLVDWKLRTDGWKKVGRDAMKVGSKVDGYAENDWRTGSMHVKKKDNAEVKSAVECWLRWKEDWPEVFGDIQAMQETVYYDDWGCAGTLDIRTSQAIIDIKCSKRISKSYWVQTGFYNRKFKLPERWILRLGKFENTGDYDFVKCPENYNQEYCENLFVGRLVNYRFEEQEREEL